MTTKNDRATFDGNITFRLLLICFSLFFGSTNVNAAPNCLDGETRTLTGQDSNTVYYQSCVCNNWVVSSSTVSGTLCDFGSQLKKYTSRDYYPYRYSYVDAYGRRQSACQKRLRSAVDSSWSEVRGTGCRSPAGEPASPLCLILSDHKSKGYEYADGSFVATLVSDWHSWETPTTVMCSNGSANGSPNESLSRETHCTMNGGPCPGFE